MTDADSFDWPDHWLPALDEIRRRVGSICYRWGVDQSTADDVFQATVLKVCEAARDEGRSRPGTGAPLRVFDGPGQLVAWASTVAFSVLNDARRKKSAAERPAGDKLPEVPARDDNFAVLAEYLDLLDDPREREVIRMHYIEGRTLAEIAARLGVSTTRVHQIREKALATTRERLGR